MNIKEEKIYAIWLAELFCAANKRIFDVLRTFQTPERAWQASRAEYAEVEGLTEEEMKALCDKTLDGPERIFRYCEANDIQVLVYGDAEYPQRLACIVDRPFLLYIKGTLPAIDAEVCISMVGTRNMTPYGKYCAERLAFDLSRGGAVVVSGMAKGVDTAAHRGALKARGRTIAVLGNGLDRAYPRENAQLMEYIGEHGALVTEYPPFSIPAPANFPLRNRIISALSLATVVVEAPASSGALITARTALGQGRDVFAVPGNITSSASDGCNDLLRHGARAVREASDILEEYELVYPDKINVRYQVPAPTPIQVASPPPSYIIRPNEKEKQGEAPAVRPVVRRESAKAGRWDIDSLRGDQRTVAECFGDDPLHADELVARSGLPVSRVMAALTLLEMGGYLVTGPGGVYEKNLER